MNVLAYLAFLLVGVLLGFWLQNPALAEREREVRQKLARAAGMVADAAVKVQIAEGALRLTQAVRRQTAEMLDFASRAPELGPTAVAWERSPIFEGMNGWLNPTGAMPVLDSKTAPVQDAGTPKARDRFATKPPRKKVAVKAVPEAPAELVQVVAQ